MAIDRVVFQAGKIVLEASRRAGVTIPEAMRAGGWSEIAAEETTATNKDADGVGSYTPCAVFVEVRVDEELGVVRVTRVVDAVAAGRILNPKTARSQIIGGMVFGWAWRCMRSA